MHARPVFLNDQPTRRTPVSTTTSRLHHIRRDDMTKIDIDRLSEAELVDLHRRIVERID